MSFRKRSTGTLTSASDGTASSDVGLSAPYARVHRVRVSKGTAAPAATLDVTIEDDDGNVIFTATNIDVGTDPHDRYVEVEESKVVDTAGEAAAADSQGFAGPIAKSPITIDVTGAGSAKNLVVDVFVEA